MFQLWQSIGVFPYQFRLIELVLDQESQGVYMLLEKPAEVIPREQPGVNAVIRRDFTPPHAVMDIKYARIDESIISGNYVNAFLDIDHLADAEQIDALEKVLDIDQFITHLASATILRNGDYIDELWFIEYQYLRKNGDIGYRYRIAKWDPEDTFRPCHHSGEFAYKDKWEIAFCVESDIGKAILSNRVLYRLFIDKIEQLLSTSLSLERFKAEINNTVNLLADKFRSDSTALAMERLQRHEGPLVGEAMVSVISAFADELINLYIERRAILTERISFYRASI
jgi:hypothetical protein